jgi:chromosome partitioning protein
MKIFSMVAQKGGTGKTTLLLNIASAAQEAGRKVLIIDVDSQASTCKWADRRGKAHPDKADYPLVMDAQPERLAHAIEKARSMGFDFILIDTPAKSGDAGLAASRIADVVLIPCRPQLLDIETIRSTKDILRIAENPIAAVILNAVPPVGFKRRDEAASAIAKYDIQVLEQAISVRAVFGDATALGLSVLEYEPEGAAAQEIRNLYNQVIHLAGKQDSIAGEDHGKQKTRSKRVG